MSQLRLLHLALGLAGAIVARGATPAAAEAVVALPPFIVEEKIGTPWRYAAAPGFEFLSHCSDATTRKVIEAQVRMHKLLAEIFPLDLQFVPAVPRAFILIDESFKPTAAQDLVTRLLRNPAPVSGKVAAPFGGLGRSLGEGGLKQRYSFLTSIRLSDRDAMTLFMVARGDESSAANVKLSADYILFLARNRVPALPPWFLSGFLSLYPDAVFSADELSLKPMGWISANQMESLREDRRSTAALAPLHDLFAGNLPVGAPAAVVRRWQAQAELFLRWGLSADGHAHREALWKFVAQCALTGPSAELFRACFGIDLATAEAAVNAYVPTAVQTVQRFRPAKPLSRPLVVLRDATVVEIARLKGDMERMGARHVRATLPELAPSYLEQAQRTLLRGYERDPRDAQLLTVLGLREVDAGDDVAARKFLEAAATGEGRLRPRAAYELARLRFAGAKAQPAAAGNRLSNEQAATVLGPLFAARAQRPPLPEVYELIAEVWAHGAETPARSHLAVLDEGVMFFPRRSELIYRDAELHLRHGFREQAGHLIALGLRFAADATARTKFTELQAQLDQK